MSGTGADMGGERDDDPPLPDMGDASEKIKGATGLWRCSNCGEGVTDRERRPPNWPYISGAVHHHCQSVDVRYAAGVHPCRWFGDCPPPQPSDPMTLPGPRPADEAAEILIEAGNWANPPEVERILPLALTVARAYLAAAGIDTTKAVDRVKVAAAAARVLQADQVSATLEYDDWDRVLADAVKVARAYFADRASRAAVAGLVAAAERALRLTTDYARPASDDGYQESNAVTADLRAALAVAGPGEG